MRVFDGDRDRLAVWERSQHGELLADGNWLVSDAERAAAGRETTARLFARLLPANQDQAARQYASGGVPEGEELVRVWLSRDPDALERRLGPDALAAWAEDDVLHVLWRGQAERAMLVGGIQLPLWPVPGAPGLWEASVRVRRLDEMVISLCVVTVGAADMPLGQRAGAEVMFRGPRAPAAAPEAPLAGELHERVLDSPALGGPRTVTVYLPPGSAGSLPGCVLADGQSLPSFASALESAAGPVPPAIVVGVHSATSPGKGRRRADLRGLEYLPRHRSRRFRAHLSFVADEVVPWAATRFGARPSGWLAAGFSNGAVWAIAAGQRRPEVFGGVTAFSAGMTPARIARASREVRHYLGAGTLEGGFRRQTSEWAARLERAGMPHVYREWAGGHDGWWWARQFPAALSWLLAGGDGGGSR